VSRRIAKKVVSLWNKTTNGKVEEMTSDLELGQLRIAEFETYHHVESVDNLPVEGKVLKIDRRIKFLVS
jgi:CRISPR/Cas system endoribonuclease Cas6 (RAMP superfamily)